MKLGAKEINDTVYCDSSSKDNTAERLFPNWSDKLVEALKSKY